MDRAPRSILVPLDGSRLAEAALPAAAELARRFGAELALLHVLERGAPETVHGQRHLQGEAAAAAYLEEVARRCRAEGVEEVRLHVHPNPIRDVPASIAAHAAELETQLIAISTHGSGGIRELITGSVAERTLRHGITSLLLVRPTPAGEAPPFRCRRLLVALDAAGHGTAALAAARTVAAACDAQVQVVTVVPTPATLPPRRRGVAAFSPAATAVVLDLERRDVEETLERIAEGLRAEGIDAASEVRRGDPLGEVLAVLADEAVDLVVVATHGHSGLGGWLAGSFTPRALAAIPSPVLLVRTGSAAG